MKIISLFGRKPGFEYVNLEHIDKIDQAYSNRSIVIRYWFTSTPRTEEKFKIDNKLEMSDYRIRAAQLKNQFGMLTNHELGLIFDNEKKAGIDMAMESWDEAADRELDEEDIEI